MNKFIVSALAVCFFACFVMAFTSCNRDNFTGTRVANPNSYTLDIESMNGTDNHAMNLKAGDMMHILFKTEKGDLHMEITAPDGAVLYSGDGKDVNDFVVKIQQDGVHYITVNASRARGKISIEIKEKQKNE